MMKQKGGKINNIKQDIMPRFNCVHCGQEFSSVRSDMACSCVRHSGGSNKGILYPALN